MQFLSSQVNWVRAVAVLAVGACGTLFAQAPEPDAATPADAASLLRENARALVPAPRAARSKPGLGKETRAHRAASLNALEEALKASLQRAAN
jgi:hypothetical protein